MLVDKRREKGRKEERAGMNGLEGLILRLLEARSDRGKRIQLTEPEIRQLCVTAKQVFLAQPVLLELEAPINICGAYIFLLLSSAHFTFYAMYQFACPFHNYMLNFVPSL
jgi:hypothetical protein